MLVAFRVANFRSIREEQELLLTRAGAGHRSRLGESHAGRDLTPVVAIYGANAAGKSTVLAALYHARELVRTSASFEANAPVEQFPFLLDPEPWARPTTFEFVFRLTDVEFRYGFEIQRELFTAEWLYETPQGGSRRVERRVFSRRNVDGADTIEPSPHLRAPKKAIIRATRSNSLFLSKAAQENHPQLSAIYEWFRTGLGRGIVRPENMRTRLAQTTLKIADSPEYLHKVSEVIQWADLGIKNVDVETRDYEVPQGNTDAVGEGLSDEPESGPHRSHSAVFEHESADAPPTYFRISMESDGTRNLFAFCGPMIDALTSGGVLSVDEIESSLHPSIVRSIIQRFQDPSTNPHGAQLVFTTHDVTLLGDHAGAGYALDRDQIWFVEKRADGATELVPLTDYKPRRDENIERFYLQGRYGAVPHLPNTWTG